MKNRMYSRYFQRYAVPAFIYSFLSFFITGLVYDDFAQVVSKHITIQAGWLAFFSSIVVFIYGLFKEKI